eukprot:gnl/TRDRNA2_/TRDRNA2_172467_c1_seq8.p1 gnl/TRDRNA2_/TRDRNA2_172467_c1~~gnl/TRDRNA2_/TRDRNA2_172467_c1_seq8.p1  ORF type:complete len:306 (+),score=18.15 gnl/TRDRNA2_/TRDRNA2_172467_c1_seq8:27-944(+)
MVPHNLLVDFNCLLEEVVGHFTLRDLVHFGSCCNTAHFTATKVANMMITSKFKSIHLIEKTDEHRHAIPLWVRLKAAMQPFCFVNGHITDWRDETKPTPFVVDSKGPVFLEFQFIAAKAPTGTPTIGLVDAMCPGGTDAGWSSDLSRSGREAGEAVSFALALNPGWRSVVATIGDGDLEKHGITLSKSCNATMAPNCYRTTLNWPIVGNAEATWNLPIRAGFFMENGNLTIWRMDPLDGSWHSSGVLCKGLPEQVSPCMFMSSFVGYAQVWLVNIWDSPPVVCPHCDASGHGTKDGWFRFLPVES